MASRLSAVYRLDAYVHSRVYRACPCSSRARRWPNGPMAKGSRFGPARSARLPCAASSAVRISRSQKTSVRVIVPGHRFRLRRQTHRRCSAGAAQLARAAGRPVQVVWTREEEFTWAYFRPAGVMEIKSGIGADGSLTAWEFHNYNSGMSAIDTPYVVPNQHIQFHSTQCPLRSGSYRGLAATANFFARESHMDELAHAAQIDPLEFRLKNLSDSRLRAVFRGGGEIFWLVAQENTGGPGIRYRRGS